LSSAAVVSRLRFWRDGVTPGKSSSDNRFGMHVALSLKSK
jgi:hypothetical protein